MPSSLVNFTKWGSAALLKGLHFQENLCPIANKQLFFKWRNKDKL